MEQKKERKPRKKKLLTEAINSTFSPGVCATDNTSKYSSPVAPVSYINEYIVDHNSSNIKKEKSIHTPKQRKKKKEEVIVKTEKLKYKDGVGGALWIPFGFIEDEDFDEDVGICFDFKEEQVDEIIKALKKWKTAEAKEYIPDEKWEKFKNEENIKKEKWWYKLKDWAEHFIFQFSPFDWNWQFKTKRNYLSYTIMSNGSGISIGPMKIHWPSLTKTKKDK